MKTTLYRSGKSALWLAALLALAFLAPSSRADDNAPGAPAADPGDPPSRVARISFLDGTVSFQPGGQGDWGSAAMNRPVTVGDKIWSDQASRAELQAGQASIHMGSMTALSFLNLDESIMQVRIAEGAINFRVREMREGDVYEVDTPNAAFTVKQAGAFRVDVSETGDATAITKPLRLGLDDAETTTGWALTDSAAAVAYGAPLAVRAEQLFDFYVPDQGIQRRATALLGAAPSASQARCAVRVAPVPAVCSQRVGAEASPFEWPLAHPLFVALDLAKDSGRGREILDAWTPPERWTRVW